MNRAERRAISKDPAKSGYHKEHKKIINDFIKTVGKGNSKETYSEIYEEYETKRNTFCQKSGYNVKYFPANFKIEFDIIRTFEQFKDKTDQQMIEMCFQDYEIKSKVTIRKPYRKATA